LDKLPRYISFIIDDENQKTKKSLTSLTGNKNNTKTTYYPRFPLQVSIPVEQKKRSNAKGGATRPRDVVNTLLFFTTKRMGKKKKKNTGGGRSPGFFFFFFFFFFCG